MAKIILIYFIIINIICFAAFAIDKGKAIRHVRRISEKTLIILCALGGALGGLAAMLACHHKTRKAKFALGVPAILLAYLGVILLICKFVLKV